MVAVMAGAPAEPGRRHECERKNFVPGSFFFLLFFSVHWATGNARLPLVALGPEPSGLGPTLALTRIHACAPAQLGRPPLRRPYRGQKRKKARGGD
ncbi:hypothetical protein NDU88_005633 [Pleurodeles waltl]|uniref:Secreted protein n=1 Tax=Pleurodeles waltl TaxID=8319 RepID=A0AAV7UKK1_PLEWA|nr:hypothetical protein NDU88_005633 [Pleurodeles waltl]